MIARSAPTATGLAAAVRAGRLDPADLVEESLSRIAAVDDELGAFVLVDADGARAQAQAVRRTRSPAPLLGVPVGVKDLFDVRGHVTRAGSRVVGDDPAVSDATAVARLRAAGAVLVGRTRTHEWAWGITTRHPDLGGTRNPWDVARVPGGSSGGSAAAVAAGLVPLALGTDTGCSIRLPAAWCGLVGFKPTWGAVPLDGVVPLAPSLDHGGALVRDVADARLVHRVLADVTLPAAGGARGRRLGVVVPPPGRVGALVEEAAGRAVAAGMLRRDVTQPRHGELAGLYAVVQGAEAISAHRARGWWPAQQTSYGRDVRDRASWADRLDPAVIGRAGLLRDRVRAEVAQLFSGVDLLLQPVALSGPSLVSDPEVAPTGGLLRDEVLPWTVLADLCGLPACAFPVGLDADGLPVGLQVVGPPGADALVLDVAEVLAVDLW